MGNLAAGIRWSAVIGLGWLALVYAHVVLLMLGGFFRVHGFTPGLELLRACFWSMVVTTTALPLIPLFIIKASQQAFVRAACLLGVTSTLLVMLAMWSQVSRGTMLPQLSCGLLARAEDVLCLVGAALLLCYLLWAVLGTIASWKQANQQARRLVICVLGLHAITCAGFLATLPAAITALGTFAW